jgi:hypothetical protein
MKSNDIFADARVLQVRELKNALAETRARLLKAETERDLLTAHFSLGMLALHDLETLAPDEQFRVIDGWNSILRKRNISKLSSEDISAMKKEYLSGLGILVPATDVANLPPVRTWIVFDGKTANSYRSGAFRVTYTGGTGAHRADRMILDFVSVAKTLGLDVSRIVVETADKDLSKRLTALGAKVEL